MRRGGRADAEPETIAREAAVAVVEDLSGRRLRLEALWAQGPVVLAFLRHFG